VGSEMCIRDRKRRSRGTPFLFLGNYLLLLRGVFCFDYITVSEQKRYAPYSGDADQRENNSADCRGLAAERPRYKIKRENADTAPV
jgi:hypothetical protein